MTGVSPQAIEEAGRTLADARARMDSLTPHQAALEAHVPGGPSVAELEDRVRAARGLPLANTA